MNLLHLILIALGVVAAILAFAQFRVRKAMSAVIYAAYAASFILAPWPRVLTYAAAISAFDGFVGLSRFVFASGNPDGLRLTEKGKKYFLGVEIANAAIRSALFAAARIFVGF
jgi:hypothetical protein